MGEALRGLKHSKQRTSPCRTGAHPLEMGGGGRGAGRDSWVLPEVQATGIRGFSFGRFSNLFSGCELKSPSWILEPQGHLLAGPEGCHHHTLVQRAQLPPCACAHACVRQHLCCRRAGAEAAQPPPCPRAVWCLEKGASSSWEDGHPLQGYPSSCSTLFSLLCWLEQRAYMLFTFLSPT